MKMNWNTCRDAEEVITVTSEHRAALMSNLSEQIAAKQGFSVATLNLDHAVKLAHDPTFRKAYAAHTHVTADGHPIVWLSRLAGQRLVSLVPGSELVHPIAAFAEELGLPMALVGGTQISLEKAAAVLIAKHPGLEIALLHAPPMGFDVDGPEAEEAISAIEKSGARIVFLALGAPRQECFAARAQGRLKNTGFLSIGAGLDFISGSQTRAPTWMRKIAAEWLWRLLCNPKRFAVRYAACFAILPRLTWRALQARRKMLV